MRKLKYIGIASKFLARNFSSQQSNYNFVRGARHSLINATRLCNYRYIAGITAKPIDEAVFSVSFIRRHFHATGPLYGNERNYYDILGVSRNAGREEIKKAFHQLAKKYHPDTNKNNPSAKRKFQEIRDAYETLQDSEKRSEYDMTLDMGSRHDFGGRSTEDVHGFADAEAFSRAYKTQFSSSFHKIFSEIFEDEVETFAADVQEELSLSFFEAAQGCRKRFSYKSYIPCSSCHGHGHPMDAKTRTCPTCGGFGKVTIPPFSSTCNNCKGSGRIITETCRVCKATGVLEGSKEITVEIPPGVDSGDTITVREAGNSGGLGAQPGNLYIRLKVADDSIFTRSDSDVLVDANISFTQAMLGGKVEVPTLSGKILLDIPKGVQPGQAVVLRGRGLPKRGVFIKRGDQHVIFRVTFPTKVNERQRAILEEFEMEEMNREEDSSFEGSWLHQQLSTG
ncbi:chaperone protein dnaJ 1, mitochondrial isoform X2 [Silene latifolia]|uniref:chaperone protein dnaJ 1, mitochondrial isoform X2 n=1 Tax=Silene latifolia TaxID=37657 RepID=UPI003D774B97